MVRSFKKFDKQPEQYENFNANQRNSIKNYIQQLLAKIPHREFKKKKKKNCTTKEQNQKENRRNMRQEKRRKHSHIKRELLKI